MNVYAVFILVGLLAGWLVEAAAEMLNLRALKPGVPAEMEGFYNKAAFAKSHAYTRLRTSFGFAVRTFDLIALLTFWFSGGFNWLDALVRGRASGVVWQGLLFAGLLLFARILLRLPFSIYGTFILEERFGFNRTRPSTFFLDLIKGVSLAVLLGGPLLAAVLVIFTYTGPWAWPLCWGAVTTYTLFVQFIAPTCILPLFNTFTPLGEGELRERIFALSRSVRFPLENVFLVDGSRRSSKSNAFFTGFGRHKRIALFDTLIEQQTPTGIVAVVAHEIGHFKKKHIPQGMALSIASAGLMLYLFSIFLGHRGLYDAFFMERNSLYAGLLFAGLLLAPLDMLLSPLMNMISRRHEYEADRFAAAMTRDPGELIASLKKLSMVNLENLTPHPVYVFLHYSHPPLLERIAALRRLAP